MKVLVSGISIVLALLSTVASAGSLMFGYEGGSVVSSSIKRIVTTGDDKNKENYILITDQEYRGCVISTKVAKEQGFSLGELLLIARQPDTTIGCPCGGLDFKPKPFFSCQPAGFWISSTYSKQTDTDVIGAKISTSPVINDTKALIYNHAILAN